MVVQIIKINYENSVSYFSGLSFSAANSGTQTPKSVIVDKRYGLEDAEEFIKKQIRKGYITKTVSINHIGEVLVVMEKY